jgi:hypothetical protein
MFKNSLAEIAIEAIDKEAENVAFRSFLQQRDPRQVDDLVFELNEKFEKQIDCTSCGNCCRSLMINLEAGDSKRLSDHLQLKENVFVEKYVECSSSGEMQIMNTIPCHFLSENKCTVYEARPTECREFPGLHKAGFTKRSFATFMHYGRCPIIYNVIEEMKREMNFFVRTEQVFVSGE